MIETIATIFADDAKAAGIALRVIPSDATLSDGTAEVLRILSNFTSNAIAYSGASTVTIAARENGADLMFEVKDDGCGMDKAMVSASSGRQVRGESAGNQNPEGKGLGLSIVAELAAGLGGQWELDSEPGKGTIARLVVPVEGCNG